jgi:hypothetical protein
MMATMETEVGTHFNRLNQVMRKNDKTLQTEALKIAKGWSKWHHSSYAAWVRHNGTHEACTLGTVLWNNLLASPFHKQLRPLWDQTMISLNNIVKSVCQAGEFELTEVAAVFQGMHSRSISSKPLTRNSSPKYIQLDKH